MPGPSTALVKTWCRIGNEFDEALPTMIAAATNLASHECGVDFNEVEMPPEVQQWVAINVAYWIRNPDADGNADMSPHVARLLDKARTYGGAV